MTRKKYIKNDVLYLAEIIESDYKILYDSWNEQDTILGYNYKLPYTFEEYCEKGMETSNWGAIIVRLEDNQVIGRIGISKGLPDLSITIFKPYRNKSYTTQAFLLGVKYCFEVLKLDKIYAGSYEDNIVSLKIIERWI